MSLFSQDLWTELRAALGKLLPAQLQAVALLRGLLLLGVLGLCVGVFLL